VGIVQTRIRDNAIQRGNIMQRITAESNITETMTEIGIGNKEKLRESERRRRNLEKFAQLRSRNPHANLLLKDSHTAFVTADEDAESEEFVEIVVTTRDFEQNQNYQLPERYHHYLIQKAMTIHEAAHIMYSSYSEMEKYLEKVKENEDETHEQMFLNIFNVLEDGAIEKFAQEDHRVDEELYHLRATLHESHYMGQRVEMENGKERYDYPFYFAVMTALLNIGVYDNKELERLLDEDNESHIFAIAAPEMDRKMFLELLPKLRNGIDEIQSERNVETRYKKIYELWQEIKKYINRSTTPGKNRMKKQKSETGDTYSSGVPENIAESHGEQDSSSSTSSGQSNNEKTEPLGDMRSEMKEVEDGSLPKEIEEKAKKDIIQEAKEDGNDWEDELEKIINSLGAGDGVKEIFVPDDGEVDIQRKKEAERYGKRCAKIFRNRLRRMQKDKEVRAKKRGEFDSRRIMQADRGSTRVFKQTKEGDEKNYSCVIVCDRSGSMRNRMEDVELSAGAVAYGLEDVGVDTSILDTYDSKTTLAKPFQTDIENFAEKLFAGRIKGGTPLRYTIQFAKQRIDRGHGDVPFMIVITDGRPRNESKVKEEIKSANFPVLGLYLSETDKKEQLKLYDKAVTVSENEDVAQRLINLINTIVF
jgi:Mg-chelatase subunit ChlD